MKEVSGFEVYNAYLSDVRKSVDALIEFAREKCDTSSPLLRVVEDAVNNGFAELEIKLKDALVCSAEKPKRDNDGTLEA